MSRGMKSWTRFCLLAAVMVAGGCSQEESKTVITFWQFWDAGVIEPMAEKFEKLNPGIEVKVEQLTWKSGLEKIQAAVASGTEPDLCELGSTWFAKFAAAGALMIPIREPNTTR